VNLSPTDASATDDLERRLREALRAHVATIDPGPPPSTSEPTVVGDHVLVSRRRPFALVAAAVLVVVAAGGVWWASTVRDDAGPVVDVPAPGAWTVPATSPLAPGQFREVMWTGSEFLVWGGVIGLFGLADGARYDPVTDAWRPMATPPAGVRSGVSAVWVGDRMVTVSPGAAHTYDPATDTWSPLGTFEELDDTTFAPDAADATDVVWTGDALFAIGVRRDDSGGRATLTAWRFDGDVWRWAGSVRAEAALPAIRFTSSPFQMSVHDPVALPDGFALWDGQRDGWRFSIEAGWQRLPTVDQYDDAGALVTEGRLVSVDGEVIVVAVGQTAETDDLRIARLAGNAWSDWTVVSERAVLGLRVLAAGDRIVAFGADLAGDPATAPGVPRLIDPTTGTSTSLDGYPIDTVIDRGAAWSGSQLLVVGGQRPTDGGEQTTENISAVSTSAALWTAPASDTRTSDTAGPLPTTTPSTTPPPTTALPEAVTGAVDGPVLRYPRPATDTAGMAAEVRGRLELEGSCLYVALDEIGERYPVLWPAGTRWDPAALAVVPPSGAPMPVGASVYGGGGYLYVDDLERLAGPDAARLAAACVDNTYGEIAVVNNAPGAIALDPG
jgi:hypothetical protein